MGIEKLANIEITDEDILWVEGIMGGDIHFDESRVAVIKNMESIDVQAFPGSGKTTILIAKLAILAKKWQYPNSGICVLSHTNVAREEIEQRLGNTEVGRKLLSYPHFIGTVHSFFDTYVALPWIKSHDYEINIIDTSVVQTYRWMKLPHNTRSYLEHQFKNESLCEYRESIGEISWNKNGNTKEDLLEVIRESQKRGYFTFGEMLLYAKEALEKQDGISKSVQNRFPILFIDEAQDTDSFQWELLNKAFNEDGIRSIRQGFGDSNQAIYGNLIVEDEVGNFPRKNALILSESRRFDSEIAKLANTVALSQEYMHGTNNMFTQKKIQHTIFLFEKQNASSVVEKFAQYILEVFTEEELHLYEKEGVHIVGMIHEKKEETVAKHFPKGIYDYWNQYEAPKVNRRIRPKMLIDYFRRGIEEFQKTGEKSKQIEWICQGLRKLVNSAKENNYIPMTGNLLNSFMKKLSDDKKIDFRNILKELAGFCGVISKEEWKVMIQVMKEFLSLFDAIPNDKVKKFGKWSEDNETITDNNGNNEKTNHYVYVDKESSRMIDMEFGSIHSVKGRTHLATLVLETYMRTHNMKSILKYLCGDVKASSQHGKKLKCQYVAMTRARALVCLAIPIDFVDENTRNKLKKIGWNLQII